MAAANRPAICSFERITPMIYAYTHPDYPPHAGWTKIGYTEKQSVEERVAQQHHTSDIRYQILWRDNALYKDGSGLAFHDTDFHRYLTNVAHVERRAGTEWFHVDGPTSQMHFICFAGRGVDQDQSGTDYTLRAEQAEAVEKTAAWFHGGGAQFLWNAKPRFGKTLSTYDLVRSCGYQRVLIVTNRPSIANSWAEDFHKFIAWRDELCFVSETDSLRGKPGVMSRDEYLAHNRLRGMVAFVSLQDLKGSLWFGGHYPKLEWLAKDYRDERGEHCHGLHFDLLVVDESQEGVETHKTETAFNNIDRDHTLYLSGTPFKQLAGDQFTDDEIYNWSYADEQEAKERCAGAENNPYERLPQLLMYTYQLSPMIYDELQRGIVLEESEEAVDPAFDLNEFFLTNESGKFIHADGVKKFLKMLFTGEKYPFSTPELRRELSHTMWYLNRVASAKALYKLMREDADLKPLFAEYEIVLAAGDGRLSEEDENQAAFDRVKQAIRTHEKTITLTVGQLTVGVTIPEWSGVLMLCNMQSPSSYMQAAFRAQNPCTLRLPNGQYLRKERAYLFDFDPARTLIIYDQFANNLIRATASGGGTTGQREENIRRLLNFFPVLGEDDSGRMVPLDAAQVLTIPRKLKSAEVVRHGFMSNFLFANIANIFGAPGAVKAILEKLTPAHEEGSRGNRPGLDQISEVHVDEEGNPVADSEIVIGTVQNLFGDKVYGQIPDDLTAAVADVQTGQHYEIRRKVEDLTKKVKEKISEDIVTPIAENYGLTQKQAKRLADQAGREVQQKFERAQEDFEQQKRIAEAAHRSRLNAAETPQEVKAAEDAFESELQDALGALTDTIRQTTQEVLDNKPTELVERMDVYQEEQKKRSAEDAIRAQLRGLCRSIPSFLMAYGDENITLANFDDYTEDDVFLAVTGITEAEFRILRDGGDVLNEETGELEHFDGHFFDEGVFNDSMQEFLKKRAELADYFDETHTEDIFDYIPPQKTNQIFTPKKIVRQMVDALERENPSCFDDPNKTFADLYMKSGLFITEIVKRLFKSDGLKRAFPDEKQRIRHILEQQVYGLAPSRIIYLIATNYILGFDPDLKASSLHFAEGDAAEAAKAGRLQELVDEKFGG